MGHNLNAAKKRLQEKRTDQEWLVPSKLLVNLPEEKLLESSLLPRLPVNLHLQLEVSRSLIVTAQVQSLSVRSAVTKNQLSFSSENSPSNDLFVRSLRTSKPISAFSLPQLALFRKLLRPTW